MNPLLNLCGVCLELHGRAVLNELNMELPAGEIHALLGANGAGKSSLAYLIMGCTGYQPSGGEILFDGQRLNPLPIQSRARLGITLAWQEPARFDGLTVRDYLRIAAHGNEVEECLMRVGLDPALYLGRAVDKTLSGGERKRIELAAVLAMRPKLAILDEPTAGIDLLSLDGVVGSIEAMMASGSTVLLITHQADVAAHAERASQICGGRIVCQGKTPDVLANYQRRVCERCDGSVCDYG
ncbi:MAG: ATP-binding cassette domain-containing protein [Methylotetracoccus sp.]|jgi:Fe-S cluster assembly ATP-binding protein|nr:ATP-binding cassette domain-containing protein [Methylotetracoccus sp.]